MFVDFVSGITPTRVISAYRLVKSNVGVLTRQGCRPCWGIALKAEGKTFYTQDGKQHLSDKAHIVLLPKGSKYAWKCVEQGECILINFDAPETGDGIYSIEVSDNGPILHAFVEMERCMSLEDPIGHLEAMQKLYSILLFLAKASGKKYIPGTKRQLLAPAMDYMMEGYADPQISNDTLAALCGMSTVYFRKTFEAVYGCPPIRFLHDLRINKAKAILLGEYDTIGQIAESVGYNSVYHFSKMFKTYTGTSPTKYAKASRK